MATPRQRRSSRKGGRSKGNITLNVTSMMDMFTIILVFLLKSYSAEGQLVTPAEGLKIPDSSVQASAKPGLELKMSENSVMVEDYVLLNRRQIKKAIKSKDYLIAPLKKSLSKYASEAKNVASRHEQKFKGSIILQGDENVPYNLLVKIMYTCGQAGFPNINLIVYRKGE